MASGIGRDIVVIGASAGGISALRTLLAGLPADLPAAVFIVVHVAPGSPGVLPGILDRAGPLPAVAARHGDAIRAGRIYVAPADHHLLLTDTHVHLSHGPRENRHRPSIDVLFRSAAVAHGPRVIGVVLTGLLDDGAAGLWAIKRRGGLAVVQDPTDAEYPDMPLAAVRATRIDRSLPLAELPESLNALVRHPVAGLAPPVPSGMAREAEIVSEENVNQEIMDTLGRRTTYTCPECGGAMWELDDSGSPRYRCHVGHAYSLLTLADEQSVRVEAALWAAMRALEENRRISDRMAERSASRGERERAAYHADRSLESGRHADVLRRMLEQATEVAAAEPGGSNAQG